MTTLNALVSNVTKPRRYISTNDTAKLIRQALKEAFPEIKFSVTSKKYSGGSSINVRWQDGPTSKQVDAIAKTFQGGSFDGMTDCKGYLSHLMNGEPVQFGADYVFCSRERSSEKEEAAAAIFAKAGDNADAWITLAYRLGWKEANAAWCNTPLCFARQFLSNITDPKFEGRKSKLAESVTFISDSNDHEAA
jgi:hypothetical protein